MPSPPPIPAIPTFTAGERLRQGKLNALRSLIAQLFDRQMGGFRTAKPLCVAGVSGGTVPNNVYTYVNYPTAELDNDGMWTSSNPGVFRINTPGIYLLEHRVPLQAVTATNPEPLFMGALIWVNGKAVPGDLIAYCRQKYPSGSPSSAEASTIVALDRGATVYFGVVQNSGVTATIDTGPFGYLYSSIEWLAPLPLNPADNS